MKKILLLLSFTLVNVSIALSQGNNCATATPFCSDMTFPNNTGLTSPSGPNYGCLATQPNPAWFFIKTTAAGTMDYTISQATGGGSGIDVDFIAWGPFANMTTACSNLTAGNIEDCSYSTAAVENMTLVSPGPGNYFVILITNYANVSGNITFDQTGGPPSDCSILCPSVTSGNGFLQTNGTPMPATVACNSATLNLIASNNTPFGNPITPAIIISFTNNTNSNNSVNWYENGTFILCSGPAPCGLGLTPNAPTDLQYSTMSPTATNLITLCEPNTGAANVGPYTITDAASGTVIASGTWNDDGACTNITFAAGSGQITGLATWSISPACPGCLVNTTDWGYTQFSPAAAGSGTYNICYSFDPPGTCPTYTYCQSITVTNPYSAAWTTPAPMCSNAASINLNALVTGTPGGTWSGTGVSGSTFNPSTAGPGAHFITYSVGTSPCIATQGYSITVNPVPVLTITNSAPSICSGSSTNITLSSSVVGTTYSWTAPTMTAGVSGGSSGTGASISQIITATATGTVTYTITATAGGCSTTGTTTVTVNPNPTVTITPATVTICSGQSATLTANPSAGGGSYSWSTGGTGSSISVSPGSTTTYTVTYTLAGCTGTAVRTITVNPSPTVSVNTPPAICSGSSATLTATPSLGGGTYSWSTGGTGSSISVSPGSTTTYTVTYTLSGCSATNTSTVTVNPTPTVSITPATSTICSGQSANLTANPSLGGGTYSWSTGASTSSISVSPASTTTYTVTYSLAGCTGTAVRTVTVNPTPTVTVNSPAAICSGSSTTLTATPSLGGGSYAWNTGAVTSSITVSPGSTTTYTVTYTLSGCIGTNTGVVTVNPTPTVSITPASVTICAGASANLTANPSLGGGTYAWSTGASSSSITVTPASTTTYTVTYSLSGCAATATRTVTITPMDNASFTYGSSTYCQTGTNPTPTITGLAGGTFSAPAGLVINASTGTINLATSTLGTYNVTYTTSGPCPNFSIVAITITSAPSASFSYTGSPYCQNGANPLPVFGPGASAGTFGPTGGGLVFVNVNTGQINLTASTPGTYNVTNTIAASGGCSAANANYSITINPAPVIAASPVSQSICSGSTTGISLSSSLGGTTYSWLAPTMTGATGGTSGTGSSIVQGLTVTSTSVGTVTYTVTSTAGGCAGNTLTIPITVNPIPNVVATPAATTICSGTSTSIALSGSVAGTTYTWTATPVSGVTGASSGSGSTISQVLSTSGVSAGTVQYNITPSANGCSGTPVSVTITVNPVPFATATPATSTICSGATTAISLSSFTAGTSYTWTVPGYSGSISGGSAGSGSSIAQVLNNSGSTSGTATYTITPSAAGCTGAPITATVTVNPVPNVTPSPASQTICSGGTTGIALSGTVAGTTFNWPVPSYSGSVSGGSAGPGTSITQTLTNSGSSSGTATYTITPTASGCPGTPVTVVITVNPNPVVTALPASNPICSGATTSIPLTSNIAGTNFTWTVTSTGVSGAAPGSGTGTIAQVLTTTGTTSGTVTYSIVATTPAGCTTTLPAVVITVNPVPTATATPSTLTMCSGGTTAIALSSNVSGTTYAWGPTSVSGVTGASAGTGASIAQTLTASGSIPGTLSYTITPTAGTCPGSPISVNVTVNPTPVLTATPASETFCSGGTTTIVLSSNVSGTSISWTAAQSGVTGANNGSGVSIADVLTTTGSTAGTATYTVTGAASGCPGNTLNVVVTVNPIDNPAFTYGSATYCQTGPDPSAVITGTTGGTFSVTPAGLVLLSTSTGLIDLSASVPGSYTVTYQTAGVCPSSSTIPLDITNAPTASFTYPTPLCSTDANPFPTFSGGSSAGVFSAAAGLTFVNVNSGEIDLASTTPGTYTVINTIAAAGGCAAASDSSSIVIEQAAVVSAGTDNTICEGTTASLSGSLSGSAVSGTWTTSGSGSFSSTTDPSAVYTPSAADITAGTVTLTYTTNDPSGVCGVVTDDMVLTITPLDDASFSYGGGTVFCSSGTNPVAVITGLSGGIFSASPAGLVFVSTSTGEIDLSGSTVGTYDVYYTTTGPCPKTDTLSVDITPAPVSTFTWTTGATAFCQTAADPSPVFGPGGITGVFSSSPSGLSIDTLTGAVDLSASVPGSYTITNTITAAGGCATSVDSLMITIDAAPLVEAGTDLTICAGNTITMANDSIGGSASSFIWTSSGTGTWLNPATTGAVYTPSAADEAAGTVILYMTTDDPAGACAAVVDSIIVTIDPTPAAPAVSSTAISACAGSAITTLSATGTGGTLTWYSDAALTTAVGTGSTFNPGVAGANVSYWVTETTGSCQGPATQVDITVNPVPVADTTGAVVSPADCGAPTGTVTGITMTTGQAPFTYQWVDSLGAPAGSGADLLNAPPGTYLLTVTDLNGCITTAGPFTISSTAGVLAAFTADPLTGETPLTINCTNTSTGAVSYLWQFGTTDSSTAVNPSFIITPLGLFDVCLIAYNAAGCTDTACVTIDVYINSVFVIPNVFTPNDDGTNDVFTVDAVGLESMHAEIYNRWGQKEYEWHTTNGGWDGRTASGVEAPDGTYFFMMKAKGIDGKEYSEHGSFSLIR